MTGKQRAKLRALAHHQDPLIQVGKNGLGEGFFDQLEALLEDHELVKIAVLQNAPYEVGEIKEEVLERTGAEFVQAIGSKLTIYRRNQEEPRIDLE
ncbi:MAG: ribosome assembly RNA-binding protein YhbY [Tissierellia bacterium]|nr:ribosome assembly RNA-binding protein YhbY [Tissierellia bacterium]